MNIISKIHIEKTNRNLQGIATHKWTAGLLHNIKC